MMGYKIMKRNMLMVFLMGKSERFERPVPLALGRRRASSAMIVTPAKLTTDTVTRIVPSLTATRRRSGGGSWTIRQGNGEFSFSPLRRCGRRFRHLSNGNGILVTQPANLYFFKQF